MLQKLPVNNFVSIEDTSQFDKDFLKNYNEESNEGYFLEVGVQYLETLHGLHNDLPFLPERMKSLSLIYMTKLSVIHIGNLKQALNHRLVLKKVQRVIKCTQNA